MSELLLAFNKHGCDKGKHGYHKEYEKELMPRRFEPLKVFEVGIFRGTSFSAYIEYLPNSDIYGADLFTRVSPKDVKILSHNRVHWVQGDSTRSHIANKIKREWGDDIKFDIMIDDATHTPDANRLTFKNTIEFLAPGGIYYVEDVWPLDLMNDKEYNHPWIQKGKDVYTKEKFTKFLKELDGYNIERIDTREFSGKPDSYLFKITQ